MMVGTLGIVLALQLAALAGVDSAAAHAQFPSPSWLPHPVPEEEKKPQPKDATVEGHVTLRGGSSAAGASLMARVQTRAVGYVRSRNGVGLSGCQLHFYYGGGGSVTYSVYTDQGGAFFINDPRNGRYAVNIVQGGRTVQVPVTINRGTINPNTLVVPW